MKVSVEVSRAKNVFSKALAEFLGTLAIVLFGCGAVSVSVTLERPELMSFVPIIFGATVCLMIYATGHISGAHFNPAVTLAFASCRRFPLREVPAYLLAQFLGGICGCVLITAMIPEVTSFAASLPSISVERALLTEFVLTFFLMFVIKAVATDSRAIGSIAGVAIGATVMIDAFVGGPLTGASMNPARTLGPALFEGRYDHIWIYFVGPILGAIAAAHTYQFIRCEVADDLEDVKGCC